MPPVATAPSRARTRIQHHIYKSTTQTTIHKTIYIRIEKWKLHKTICRRRVGRKSRVNRIYFNTRRMHIDIDWRRWPIIAANKDAVNPQIATNTNRTYPYKSRVCASGAAARFKPSRRRQSARRVGAQKYVSLQTRKFDRPSRFLSRTQWCHFDLLGWGAAQS